MAATQLSSNVKADMKRLSANLLWVKPDDVGGGLLLISLLHKLQHVQKT